MNTFIELFAEQFDDTEVAVFTPATVYKELEEWSSMMALSVMAMVEDEYGVKLKGDDIRAMDTIEQLCILVKSRI